MAESYFCQDVFSKGELSPKLAARITTATYFKGLKRALNILPNPQGNAQKRFGTLFRTALNQYNYEEIKIVEFDYLFETTYFVVFYDDNIDIYLEDGIVATISGTGISSRRMLKSIQHVSMEGHLRVAMQGLRPHDLVRQPNAPASILGYVDNLLEANTPIYEHILPVRFTTTGSLPNTFPQIVEDVTYFSRHTIGTGFFSIHETSEDALNDINAFEIIDHGIDASAIFLNTWSFNPIQFRNVPVRDFTQNYDAISFTPAAISGSTTITASAAIFSLDYVGGMFSGNGGIARITGFTSSTVIDIDVIQEFENTNAIPGRVSTLTEPAWSDKRGWPAVCSTYQNRSIFACSDSLPNGLWLSVINDYNDFDDTELFDDNAISWYPTADGPMRILYVTPFRTLLVHTSSGVYSSPMTAELAITPRNFFLSLQDSSPVPDLPPVIVDNQCVIVSGRDVHSIIYDINSGGYNSAMISAISEHLITKPLDATTFVDRRSASGKYLFLTNSDSEIMATYQTLLSEEVSGWTPIETHQSSGQGYFRYTLSSSSGRCWFVVERAIYSGASTDVINSFDSDFNALFSSSITIPDDTICPAIFLGDKIPDTLPKIKRATYYYVRQVDNIPGIFRVYKTEDDARDNINAIKINDAGTDALISTFLPQKRLIIEELGNDVRTDCTIKATVFSNIVASPDLHLLNAQVTWCKVNGSTYDQNGIIDGFMSLTAMGNFVDDSSLEDAIVGLPIECIIEPMPISISMTSSIQSSNLALPQHIRSASLLFDETVGGKINGKNIALAYFTSYFDTPPTPRFGKMDVSIMRGWDAFRTPPLIIVHNEPYNFNLLGIFYKVEI